MYVTGNGSSIGDDEMAVVRGNGKFSDLAGDNLQNLIKRSKSLPLGFSKCVARLQEWQDLCLSLHSGQRWGDGNALDKDRLDILLMIIHLSLL